MQVRAASVTGTMRTIAVVVVIAVVAATVAQVSAASAEPVICPDPFILISNTSCFVVPGATSDPVQLVSRTWANARDICDVLYGADLAVINDCNVLQGLWNWIQYDLNIYGNFWVGGSDSTVEGTWEWVRTGKGSVPKGVPYWYPGQPDGDVAENKLVISQDGFFADGNENELYYFICQHFF